MPAQRLVLAGTLTGLLAALPARAEPAEATRPPSDTPAPVRAVTIREALAYAREHQPAIRAALSRVFAQSAAAQATTAQWLPSVRVTAQAFAMTANNTTGTYVDPAGMDVPRVGGTPVTTSARFSPYGSTFVGAGLLQELFDFGRIGAERAAADALTSVARHQADGDRLEVDFGVEEAFFSVLAAKGLVRAADEAYARSLVHRDLAQHGVDAGLRSPIELTRAAADLARYDVGRVRARGGLAVAQTVLAAAMGSNEPALDAAEVPAQRDMPSLHDALVLAEGRDPTLAAAVAQLQGAEEEARAIGAELRPNLSLTATLSGRAGGAPASTGPTPDGDGWIPSVPNWDVGVLLTWPLFDGVVAARRDAAQAATQVRRDEIDGARLAEVALVRRTFEQVQVARSAVVALENSTVAARANWAQADARFRAGVGNAVELADAEAVRTDAEVQLALGQFDLERARAAFGRAIAEGL